MADPRFFKVAGPFSLEQLAEISGSEIGDKSRETRMFSDILPLDSASQNDVSFIDNRRYIEAFRNTNAGAVVVAPELVDQAPESAALLITDNPYTGYAKLTQAFYPQNAFTDGKINAHAIVDPSAKTGKNVSIDAGVVIEAEVEIGDNTQIGANTVIGVGVIIGNNCLIAANVTLIHCIIGSDTIIHTGVRIGQDGFGFAPGMPRHTKVLQLGRVLIGNEVEIGANTTIDRGAGPDTIVGDGTKIDNLVQIGHNVQIGEGCFIVAQTGLSGSTVVGNFVALGGQVGIAGHLTIGDGAKVAAKSGVSIDVAPGVTVAGIPAQNARDHWKGLAMLRRLVKEKRGK
tara:strand:- start:2630 stop:3658 length:1029 start_codon:yes stop_codon:yes gene_type:complete